MRTGRLAAVAAVIVLGLGWAALIGAAPGEDPIASPAPPAPTTDAVSVRPPASPVVTEMRTRLDLERDQLRQLNERYRAAGTEQEALAVVREIARVKLQTQIDLVEIQLRHVRERGDAEAAARLETALEELRVREFTGEARPRASLDQE